MPAPIPAGIQVRALSMSSSDVFAVGDQGPALRWHLGRWSLESVPTDRDLFAAWDSLDTWVVGAQGTLLRQHLSL